MISLIFSTIYFLSVESALINPKRNLQKCLLSNLRDHYAGVGVANIPITREFELSGEVQEKTKIIGPSDTDNFFIFEKLPNDIQYFIPTFLSPQELLTTRLVSRHFCNISNFASYVNLKAINPDFSVKENWMNLAFSNFLFKNFELSRLNEDDLLNTVWHQIFCGKKDGEFNGEKNIYNVNILSFLYEYHNGINSYIPLSERAFSVEMVHKLIREDHLPKTKAIMNEAFESFWRLEGLSGNQESLPLHRNIYNETISFLKSNPDSEQIRAYFNLNPNEPLNSGIFKMFPVFFKVALFDWILPLCSTLDHFIEAIDMASRISMFPPVLYKQLLLKHPMHLDLFFQNGGLDDSAAWRIFYERNPNNINITGLNYLLSRNIANPFNLNDLLAMNPDIHNLLNAFLDTTNLSLTDIDILAQIKEGGLFTEIRYDVSLLKKLDSILDGSGRFLSLYV